MKPLWDSTQVREYLGISYRKFIDLTHDPSFPARKVRGRWRVDPEELEEWFKNQPGNQENVVQMPPKRKRGRPLKARLTPPPGGWQVRMP